MGLFSAISKWSSAKYEKKISEMESQGTCPDCYGRGFSPWVISEFSYADYNCLGCNGSGLFSDWAENTQQ